MIPGYSSYNESRGGSSIINICFYYKAEEIINYYFEKLQELEYFNIEYKSLTKA